MSVHPSICYKPQCQQDTFDPRDSNGGISDPFRAATDDVGYFYIIYFRVLTSIFDRTMKFLVLSLILLQPAVQILSLSPHHSQRRTRHLTRLATLGIFRVHRTVSSHLRLVHGLLPVD
jgi:hypothetical protein